jgi:hypothetical protein
VKAERASCAPDRRLDLSLFRTPTPSKKKITIAASTLGIVAAAAGSITVWSAGAAAQPAATARQAYSVRQQAPRVAVQNGALRLAPRQAAAELDAFTAVSAAKASQPSKHRLTSKQIARRMLHSFHWRKWEFRYLNLLWSRESSWNVHAANPYSGAYGIPQAVPGSKMSSAGPNWEGSARTQIRWGLRYIKGRYGSPYWAWQHERTTGWY